MVMRLTVIRLIAFLFVFLFCTYNGITQVVVEKSSITEVIEGKRYYMHTIEQGQTLYSISRVYDLSIDEIYFENPDARSGLQTGDILRIPSLSRDKEISNELRSSSFNYIFHIVQQGETLYSISKIYDVSLDDLKYANPGADQSLKIGQYLKVPVRSQEISQDEGDLPAEEPASQLIKHVVAAEETLFSISKEYNLSVDDLKQYNPGLTNQISVGDVLYIPFDQSPEPSGQKPYIEHSVVAQETLYGIAMNYGVSIDSIKMINPGLSESIRVGQVILIPKRIDKNDFITHNVNRKSKLVKIARMYSIDIDEIREINPSAKNKVLAGTILKIPIPPVAGLPVAGSDATSLPPEIYELVDRDSIRCHQDYDYEDVIFKVALMLPLYLEELDSLPVLDSRNLQLYEKLKSFGFIQFIEGFTLAVDSLRKQGLNVEIYVYDVDDKIAKTIKVLQDPGLMEMDLIIGPLFRKNFKLVSNYSKLFDIKIVNPLTTRDEVLDYANVFKVKPTHAAQLGLVDQLVKSDYPDAKIIIVRHNQFSNAETVQELKAMLERGMSEKVQIANSLLDQVITGYSLLDTALVDGEMLEGLVVEDIMIYREFLEMQMEDSTTFRNRVDEVVYSEENIEGIKKKSSIIRPTVIIAVSDKKVFALGILTQLNELRDSFNITLIGIPEWSTFSDLETEYLQNLNTMVFGDSYIDYQRPEVKAFVLKYRDRYKTEPMEYAFDGFDIGYYFLSALMRYGKDFHQCIPYFEQELIQNKFIFRHERYRGYENQHWNIFGFDDYTVRKLNE